jgi:hypothetical protein
VTGCQCEPGQRCAHCREIRATAQAARRARRIEEGTPARQVWGHMKARPNGWAAYNGRRAYAQTEREAG